MNIALINHLDKFLIVAGRKTQRLASCSILQKDKVPQQSFTKGTCKNLLSKNCINNCKQVQYSLSGRVCWSGQTSHNRDLFTVSYYDAAMC